MEATWSATEIPGKVDLEQARTAVAAGRFAAAETAAYRAIEASLTAPPGERGDVVVRAHELICRVHLHNGDLVRAADAVVRASMAVMAATPSQRRTLLAISGIATALVFSEIGDHDNALFELDRALPQLESTDDAADLARTLLAYGTVMRAADRPGQARVWLHSAHRLARTINRQEIAAEVVDVEVATWYSAGQLAARYNEPDAAQSAWQTGVSEAQAAFAQLAPVQGAQRRRLALVVQSRSLCLAALGRYQEAYTGLIKAQETSRDVLSDNEIGRVSYQAAQILHRQGELDQASSLVSAAIEQAQDLPGNTVLVELLELASRLAEERGEAEQALALHRLYHELHGVLASDIAQTRERILLARKSTRRSLTHIEGDRRSRGALATGWLQPAIPPAGTSVDGDALAVSSPDSRRDASTGVLAREGALAYLAHSLARAADVDLPLSIAMIDIDHFAEISTRFSAEVADQVGRAVAAVVVDTCRAEDVIARLEDAHFVAVFNDVPLREASAICERIRLAISGFGWSQLSADLEVTVSIGLADVRSVKDAPTALAQVSEFVRLAHAAGHDRVACQPAPSRLPGPRLGG